MHNKPPMSPATNEGDFVERHMGSGRSTRMHSSTMELFAEPDEGVEVLS